MTDYIRCFYMDKVLVRLGGNSDSVEKLDVLCPTALP